MGRSDAVQFTLEVVAEWRRLGARVTFEPGWETRGNGQSANYEGALIHHTGFGSSLANPNPGRSTLIGGRPDLSGPLCNSTGPACADNDPWIHVISAHPANHAGASGGHSMGPLPVTSLFNGRVWGHETDYGGNVPMLPGQYTAGLIVARGVCNVLGRSTEYTRAHAETSVTGKWDIGYATGKTYDMAAFRRDAANFNGLELDVNLSDPISFKRPDTGAVVTYTVAECLAWTNWYAGQEAAASAENAKTITALKATVDGLVKTLGSGSPAAGSKLPTEFDVPGFATLVASQVVDMQNKQARDGDPATGPVS